MGSWFSKKFDPNTDIAVLRGKVAMVTGANTGIGRSTVKHLVRQGATVYLCARNESKGTGAISAIEADGLGNKGGKVIFHQLDLSDPRDAKKSAEAFLTKEKRLDILVDNAGLLACPNSKTSDGIMLGMVVNHISPFVFTQTLLPLLEETAAEDAQADVRIVIVSSTGHTMMPSSTRYRNVDDFNAVFATSNPDAFRPSLLRYNLSKLANILYASELQRRLAGRGSPVTVMSLHPGLVNTFSDLDILPIPTFLAKFLLGTFGLTPDEGAYTSVFAAASPLVKQYPEKYKGKYLTPVGKVTKPSNLGHDEGLAKELWATTEKILEDIGVAIPSV